MSIDDKHIPTEKQNAREDKLAEAVRLMAKVIDDGNKQHEKTSKRSKIGAFIAAITTLVAVSITVIST